MVDVVLSSGKTYLFQLWVVFFKICCAYLHPTCQLHGYSTCLGAGTPTRLLEWCMSISISTLLHLRDSRTKDHRCLQSHQLLRQIESWTERDLRGAGSGSMQHIQNTTQLQGLLLLMESSRLLGLVQSPERDDAIRELFLSFCWTCWELFLSKGFSLSASGLWNERQHGCWTVGCWIQP